MLVMVAALLAGGAEMNLAAPTPTADAAAIMSHYPPAARAAGIGGKAFLACVVSVHAGLGHCQLEFETPRGYGFGNAALGLAALSKDNPEVTMKSLPTPVLVVFKFELHPPWITPNTLAPAHFDTDPDFAKRPDPHDISYPPKARARGLGGRVVLDCSVSLQGKIETCNIEQETPPGEGFGQAALQTAAKLSLRPATHDGAPVDGGHIEIPMAFTPQ